MPVVELSYSRLRGLVGATRGKISELLPFLGLDIESEDGDLVRVEYSPNRPDYSTEYGIAIGLEGLLGARLGMVRMRIRQPGRLQIGVLPGVARIRPYVTGIAARGGAVSSMLIRQLMSMQEDLHSGLGRRRTKSSVGIHDLDRIQFPLTYGVRGRDHRFVPLHHSESLSISQILRETDVGREYGGILDSPKVPVMLDANGSTVSLPPVINAAATTLTESTRNVFVEVTGTSKKGAEDMLAVLALVLQAAGFALERIDISGSRNSTPMLAPRKMSLDPALVIRTLGLEMTVPAMVSSLRRSRLDAVRDGGHIECTIPPYRFDILGPMDLVEEVALGYGIYSIEPVLPPSPTVGRMDPAGRRLKHLGLLMVGLGYTEALNPGLVSSKSLYDMTGRSARRPISVVGSKSLEHTVLRDSVLPGLVENLSRNIHVPYPQRLFETGTIFGSGQQISETVSLACLSAHKGASFSEAKSALQSVLGTGFGISVSTRASSDPMLERGHAASILSGRKTVGVIGQISPDVLERYRIRVPVSGFEISLSGLIFDSQDA